MTKHTTNRLRFIGGNAFAFFILCSSFLMSCEPTENQATATTTTQATADTVQLRPAPTFFIIEPGTERNRVLLCENNSDVFHVSKDCEVLQMCKGTMRNVTLLRAIEEFGRYNCEVCSQELSDIFDEEKIR